jgi:hypothetical protein
MIMTIDSLLDEKKPVYVRNIHVPRGVVVFTLVSPSGRTTNGIIPKTRHPICLNNLANPDTIRNSDYLRRLIASGVLELVDPYIAEKELSDPEVQADLKASWDDLSNKRRSSETGKTEQTLPAASPASVMQDTMIQEIQQKLNISNARSIEHTKEPVQSRVYTIIAALKDKQRKPRETRRELSSLDLTKEDLIYIISNTVPGIVNQYAKGLLAKIAPDSELAKTIEDRDEEFTDDSVHVSVS